MNLLLRWAQITALLCPFLSNSGYTVQSKNTYNTSCIIISKSDYQLTLIHKGKLLKDFPVVFGYNPKDQKKTIADGCTPEGRFYIKEIKKHPEWSKIIHLQANDSKIKAIFTTYHYEFGIHGVPEYFDNAIDLRHNWTFGSIAMKNKDLKELLTYVYTNMPVYIQ